LIKNTVDRAYVIIIAIGLVSLLLLIVDSSQAANFGTEIAPNTNPVKLASIDYATIGWHDGDSSAIALTFSAEPSGGMCGSSPPPPGPMCWTIGDGLTHVDGSSGVYDFTSLNDPDFENVVSILTNNQNDMIYLSSDAPERGGGTLIGDYENSWGIGNPDLAGYSISFIRLVVHEISIYPENLDGISGTRIISNSTWEIWGTISGENLYNITFLPPITTMEQFNLTNGSTLPIKFTARNSSTNEFIYDDTVKVGITDSTGHLIIYFTNGSGTNKVKINAAGEQYIANLHTKNYVLNVGEKYTVTVTFGEADALRGYDITYFTLNERGKAKSMGK
jgi:hypothetical protein